MRRSQTITTQIDYPYALAYAYLADPRNYSDWAAVDPARYFRLDNGDWYAEVRFGGFRHIRFTPENAYGVLDHAVFLPGEELIWTPMRAVPNENGTELTVVFFQRPEFDEDVFLATVDWITMDLMTLKALLEARRR